MDDQLQKDKLAYSEKCIHWNGDRKDQKALERLRAERQAKIDELKEKTNYYSTQQLIQRYDPDPAAKAAAATVLASKLGADSGLKLYMGDESKLNDPTGQSHDFEIVKSSGIRNRKQSLTRSSSTESTVLHQSNEEMIRLAGSEGPEISEHNQLVVEHGDRKDQKALERLRAERQAKIDELKEKTNYYSTQQLIQRYDPDPAAKAAAATVLASKLGADSGLKLYMGDESKLNDPTGQSHDFEIVKSSGIRNRKQSLTRSSSTESTVLHQSNEEMIRLAGSEGPEISEHNQLVVEHGQTGLITHDGGWIARIAALLVGEDPTQSYALICGNCHMHNGLVRKEDFPYITYYCPHCNALNRPNQLDEHASGSNTPTSSSTTVGEVTVINNAIASRSDTISESCSPVAAAVETTEESEKIVSEAPVS
ncbi:unnamed protein product [Ilex paraguariensis]|uniref:Lunapark zinc ribbon domain-containing protein n=1 Tax=Ilex paraguariensis TaxID=185542 RepID=A0ABC8QYC4_9AQUA